MAESGSAQRVGAVAARLRELERPAYEVEAQRGDLGLLEEARPDARQPPLGQAEEDGAATCARALTA